MRCALAVVFVAGALLIVPATATASLRLVSVTSSVSAGAHTTLTYTTLTVSVSSSRVSCSVTVAYKSARSHATALYRQRPHAGRVSWTFGPRTTPGRWLISVSCGSAGSLRVSIVA